MVHTHLRGKWLRHREGRICCAQRRYVLASYLTYLRGDIGRTKKSLRAIIVGAAVTSLLYSTSSMSWADAWSRDLRCGIKWTATMTTKSSLGAEHYYNGVFRARSAGAGSLSSVKKPVSGAVNTTAWTAGSFSSHSSSCYCADPTCGG